MTEAEILRIEATLGHPLPGEYRYFLRRYSEEVRRIKQAVPHRAVLWTNADETTDENQYESFEDYIAELRREVGRSSR